MELVSQRIRKVLANFTLMSVSIFPKLFSIHFLRCCQGEFVYQLIVSVVGDRVLYKTFN